MKHNLRHYAYIGDAVFELFVRKEIIKKTSVQHQMHKLTTKYVCAKAQSEFLDKIIIYLTSPELEIQRRGRNLKISINKKHNPYIHSRATSFETLIGYLYLMDRLRLDSLLEVIKDEINKDEQH